jgi:hypothetical protein
MLKKKRKQEKRTNTTMLQFSSAVLLKSFLINVLGETEGVFM